MRCRPVAWVLRRQRPNRWQRWRSTWQRSCTMSATSDSPTSSSSAGACFFDHTFLLPVQACSSVNSDTYLQKPRGFALEFIAIFNLLIILSASEKTLLSVKSSMRSKTHILGILIEPRSSRHTFLLPEVCEHSHCSGHELALLHNDISPLENHHASTALQLLRRPDCNFLADAPRSQQALLLNLPCIITLLQRPLHAGIFLHTYISHACYLHFLWP